MSDIRVGRQKLRKTRPRPTATSNNSIIRRVGIDFGGTIGLMVESDHDEPLPFAFAMIQHLVSKFGPQNVFIVSKAGPIMEQEIRQWLERTDIYERTGFQQSQVIFVREYSDKAQVVQELKISIFFDDSVKVVRCLAPLPEIDRVFWMYANPRDVLLIPKEHRSKVAITKRWSTTMKYLQKISSR